MGKRIQTFLDGSYLEYDWGSFDDWCVYMVEPNQSRKPPLDTDYFSDLIKLSNIYGKDSIYKAFVIIYDNTGKEVSERGLEVARLASLHFEKDQLKCHKIFTILYMAMIAEENKRFTKLGKRIKRLGLYKLLFENASVQEAANFMRGMGWKEIDKLCLERGF